MQDAKTIMLQGLGQLDNEIGPVIDQITNPSRPGSSGEDGGGLSIPPPETPPGFVAPGAVPVYAEAWDTSADPTTYQIQSGDTLVGLAATYLGDGGRWREIWNYQSAEVRAQNSPDAITTTRTLRMPPEARDAFLTWVDRGKPGGEKPGEIKPTTVDKIARQVPGGRKTVYAAAGVGVLGLLYWASQA